MEVNSSIKSIREKIQMAIGLEKCRRCGCMKETLGTIKKELVNANGNDFFELLNEVESSIERMETAKYN